MILEVVQTDKCYFLAWVGRMSTIASKTGKFKFRSLQCNLCHLNWPYRLLNRMAILWTLLSITLQIVSVEDAHRLSSTYDHLFSDHSKKSF